MSFPEKIMIAGFERAGFGGFETVVTKLIELIQCHYPDTKISLFFYNEGQKTDTRWLQSWHYKIAYSRIRNHKLRRFKLAYQFARFIAQQQPDAALMVDPMMCYLGKVAKVFTGVRMPYIFWPHGSLEDAYRFDHALHANAYLAISSGIKKQLERQGVQSTAIEVVYNPVSQADFIIPRAKTPSFLYVGRVVFEGQKMLKDLFDALANLQGSWVLHIVGDGTDIQLCIDYVRQLNIADKVIFHGWQSQPWRYVRESIPGVSACILTSKHEGFGMVLAEAAAHGVFCISADCLTGPADIIQPGVNGKLYPPGDQIALTRCLQNIVDGAQMPDHKQIQNSVSRFYDETYFAHFAEALTAIVQRNRLS